MKRILFALCFLASIFADAQSTTPRFGTSSNQDNTYRGQKLTYRSITDAALQDTFTLFPVGFTNIVKLTVTDTVCIHANIVGSYFGDRLDFVISNSSGANHFVKFTNRAGGTSPWKVGSGTAILTLTSASLATISFVFNGVSWVEVARMVQ